VTFEIQASVPPHLVTSVTIRGSRSSRKHVLYNVMVKWPKTEDLWGWNVARIYGPTDIKTAKKLRDEYRLVVEAAKVLHGLREVDEVTYSGYPRTAIAWIRGVLAISTKR